ncbi:response regulator [Desulfocapsa sp. AH-315-G09]|nr:response regulator [Desulfocapsa sp.]MBN4048527.1 response regulator [bacterium AH-315-N22]MBN4058624.1 response regulator [Desulfocapsa sp. AH-315-J15]MBN4065199.1 response regulator [Desulfocapsa sp. AH-315-G09]
MTQQKILIIDDDPAQHEILDVHLSLAGFDTLHATSSAEGFERVKDHTVALILLDINMPKMDGFQTIEILRSTPQTRDTPVLFLTSLDRQYLKVKGLELGADDYVTKPFNGAELIARIKAILRRQSTSSEKFALSGDIQEIGMCDLLQNISQSLKTGKILFSDMNGELIISGENILYARQGTCSNIDGLLRLMLLEYGRFSVTYGAFSVSENEQAIPVMKALLSGVNEIDQIKMAVKETTGQADPFLELTGNATGNASIDALKAKFPCRLIDLATTMSKPLKNNVYNILKAIHTKRLTVLPADYSSKRKKD